MSEQRFYSGKALGAELCKQFGIDSSITKTLVINCALDGPAVIVVEQFVDPARSADTTTVRTFKVVDR